MENFLTEVLIVGAGPTGLMAANQVMRFGVKFMIVDTKEGPTKESRAIVVTPRSMEIYQQLGLQDRIMEQSHQHGLQSSPKPLQPLSYKFISIF